MSEHVENEDFEKILKSLQGTEYLEPEERRAKAEHERKLELRYQKDDAGEYHFCRMKDGKCVNIPDEDLNAKEKERLIKLREGFKYKLGTWFFGDTCLARKEGGEWVNIKDKDLTEREREILSELEENDYNRRREERSVRQHNAKTYGKYKKC